MCPACGEPLRPDYGEAVDSIVTVARVYAVHTGRCADRLCTVLAELGETPARRRP